ncbi:MAG: hypothetical protein Q9P44_01275 [Anaerolineae bacterium]|nr:hypothetical protein [Anaerolineae bacterium]
MPQRFIIPIFILIFLSIFSRDVPLLNAQTNIPGVLSNPPQDGYIRSQRLGVTFISSAQIPVDENRYRNGLLLGAGWNRWPLYWNEVETAPGNFNWAAYDNLVRNDIAHGLSIDAILLDRPDFFADGAIIAGLNQPVFSDGSDNPGPDKEINANNPWAIFVFRAVQRYKPGGELAREQGWINGEGISLWEIWNEPDLALFWQGGMINYARLLKVAYLAAHFADPTTTVMFGGLLYSTPDNWLARVLAIYENDPNRAANNWYMDAVALHSYSYPWRTGWLTLFTSETLRAYGLDRPIFVNETGISVWNDYPGPVWAASSAQRYKLGTAEQQAWFVIQNTVYAYSEGADVVFFHQLYDDCGDQAAGTNFPPNNGELCTGGAACFGDAWGLYRNTSESICYSQHPNPGSPRPSANAYRLLASVFGTEPFSGGTEVRANGITDITFDRPMTNERIHVIWNRRFEPNITEIQAEGLSATLYTLGGVTQIAPEGSIYRLELRAAQADNFPELEAGDISAIGGEPVILVERIEAGSVAQPPPAVQASPTVRIAPTVQPLLSPTPGPVIAAPIQPTVAPENDTQAPTTAMDTLSEVSARTFVVRWRAQDNGAIDRYIVWVRINDGGWTPWVETQRTEGIYTGTPGNSYSFAVWAVDRAGNWSPNTDLQPQTQTRVE